MSYFSALRSGFSGCLLFSLCGLCCAGLLCAWPLGFARVKLHNHRSFHRACRISAPPGKLSPWCTTRRIGADEKIRRPRVKLFIGEFFYRWFESQFCSMLLASHNRYQEGCYTQALKTLHNASNTSNNSIALLQSARFQINVQKWWWIREQKVRTFWERRGRLAWKTL